MERREQDDGSAASERAGEKRDGELVSIFHAEGSHNGISDEMTAMTAPRQKGLSMEDTPGTVERYIDFWFERRGRFEQKSVFSGARLIMKQIE
jgi:hypothetical protein